MLGWLICPVLPNFIKIGTVAEISHSTIFKMMAVRHLGFFYKFDFLKSVYDSQGPILIHGHWGEVARPSILTT